MHLTDAIALEVYTVVLISLKSESKKFVITRDPLHYSALLLRFLLLEYW